MAPARPIARPPSVNRKPSPTTIDTTFDRLAPSATRTPNSCVRWLTEKAMTPAIPAAVITSASAANKPSNVVVSRGGASEDAKHHEMYRRTLEVYREVFGQPPPPELWSDVERRFGHDTRAVRLHTDDVFVVGRCALLVAAYVLVAAGAEALAAIDGAPGVAAMITFCAAVIVIAGHRLNGGLNPRVGRPMKRRCGTAASA